MVIWFIFKSNLWLSNKINPDDLNRYWIEPRFDFAQLCWQGILLAEIFRLKRLMVIELDILAEDLSAAGRLTGGRKWRSKGGREIIDLVSTVPLMIEFYGEYIESPPSYETSAPASVSSLMLIYCSALDAAQLSASDSDSSYAAAETKEISLWMTTTGS